MTNVDGHFEESSNRSTRSPTRSNLPPAMPDFFNDETNELADPVVPNVSLSALTPQKTTSLFNFSSGRSPGSILAKDDEKDESKESKNGQTEETAPGDRSFNFRNWLSADLQQEAQEVVSRGRGRRPSEHAQGDVNYRHEKKKREARSKERNARQSEVKSLMEQVASIAAQSRGIMRAQPKQKEEQKLMGEIIAHMGKMAEKLSRLMLVTEPKDDQAENDDIKYGENALTEEVADEKAEQILALLARGENSFELEWKRLEIKAILTSETNHSRKRVTDKRRALDGLALDESWTAPSTSTPLSSKSPNEEQRRDRREGSSNRSRLHRSSSSKSAGNGSRRMHSSRRSLGTSLGHINSAMDTDERPRSNNWDK